MKTSKTVFDITKYKDVNVVMHCPTKSSAEAFLEHLDSVGREWCDGIPYDARDAMWDEYEENTCYAFNEGIFGDLDDYKHRNYLYLHFFDFIMPENPLNKINSDDSNIFDGFISEFTII